MPCRHSLAWTLHCDGSARPNPGRMGIGFVLREPDGTRHVHAQALTGTGCNNEAELRALTAALAHARARGAREVLVCCDSSIVVEQLSPARRAGPIAALEPLFCEARRLLGDFGRVDFRWIPRHRNAEADALARAAIGLPPKPAGKR